MKKSDRKPVSYRVVSIIIFIITAYCVPAWPAESLENRVKEYVLDNGLKILVLNRPGTPIFSAYIRFLVGAVDEQVGRTGSAHILEHMMFKGSKRIGTKDFSVEKEIMDDVERIGKKLDSERQKGRKADPEKAAELKKALKKRLADQRGYIIKDEISEIYTRNGASGFNAFTGPDTTTYLVKLPNNKLELWAWLESDRIRSPVMREFYSERDVVMEERRRSVDNSPEGTLYEQFKAVLYIAHPYGWPIIGWESDIGLLPKDTVRDFLRTYYSPNNAVVAIVGDIEPDKVYRTIKKYFSDIPAQYIPPRVSTKEPPQKGERRLEVEMDANPSIMIGFHKPSIGNKDDYVFDIIDSVLTQGRTSRLYKSLVLEKGVAVSVSGFGAGGALYDNAYALHITPRAPHTTEEVEEALYEELNRLKEEPISDHELQKVLNNMEAGYIRKLRSNSGLAYYLSDYESITGDWRYMVRYLDEIRKITPADVMEAAKKYLVKTNRTVATLVPKKTDISK
ncbi:MAG: M16 family metallopeptidase [Nitrospinota bacterium]